MNVMTVRRKPNRFEVVLVSDILATSRGEQRWQDMPQWLNESYRFGRLMIHTHDVTLSTNMGHMTGRASDYIMRRPDGYLQVVTHEEFNDAYEEVDTPTQQTMEDDHAAHEERRESQARDGEDLRR